MRQSKVGVSWLGFIWRLYASTAKNEVASDANNEHNFCSLPLYSTGFRNSCFNTKEISSDWVYPTTILGYLSLNVYKYLALTDWNFHRKV